MDKKAFFYNLDHCVGCGTCQIACKDTNNLPIGILFRRVDSYETGFYPNASCYNFAATCNHCESPSCVAVCPTGAMYTDAVDGTTQHDDGMCIGCQYCVNACPFGNPRYIKELMVVHKCDACIKLRAAGEEPACVASCPARALEFGRLDDLQERHPNCDAKLPVLPDPSLTSPALLMQKRPAALLREYRELLR
jgi:anaerobic dimethyl sulfoxide reductase subunit B (iron-sulfur subunit)